MTVHVVFLRAINVGGHNKIPMADLRESLADAGLADIATYIQSGNIVCRSELDGDDLRALIAQRIASDFGHDIGVVSRSLTELTEIVAGYPYDSADPKLSGVIFLNGPITVELDAAHVAPDEFMTRECELYVNNPNGVARSKLTNDWVEKQTGHVGTRRNWNTVLKMVDMAAPLTADN